MNLRQELLYPQNGHFGKYGGCYIPELLIPIMEELQKEFYEAIKDPTFLADLDDLYHNYAGRKTPLYHCKNLSEHLGGAQI